MGRQTRFRSVVAWASATTIIVAATLAILGTPVGSAPPEPQRVLASPVRLRPRTPAAPRARRPRELSEAEIARRNELRELIRAFEAAEERCREEMRASWGWDCALAADGTPIIPDWVQRDSR